MSNVQPLGVDLEELLVLLLSPNGFTNPFDLALGEAEAELGGDGEVCESSITSPNTVQPHFLHRTRSNFAVVVPH